MTKSLYSLGIGIYGFLLWIFHFFNAKAKLWWGGRENIWQQITEDDIAPGSIWIHCSSLGEFEQGRPVLEAIKNEDPAQKIVLTFFSPSGYEVRKNYPRSDYIYYLPLDTKKNADRFLDMIQPRLAIFIKYDFWFNYLHRLSKKNIPFVFISLIMRPGHFLLQSWGVGLYRIFDKAACVFVQDKMSHQLLQAKGMQVQLVGDTRVDRVMQMQLEKADYPVIERLKRRRDTIVMGSVWMQDLKVVVNWINQHIDDYFFIIAPHDVSPRMIEQVHRQVQGKVQMFSNISSRDTDVLIVDTIGDLAHLYTVGDISYVGGGFGEGLHSILEPAASGLPIVFGPNHKKFKEATELIEAGAAITVKTSDEFSAAMTFFLDDKNRQLAKAAIAQFLEENRGATASIVDYLKQEKWI